MNPHFHTDFSISDSLIFVRKSVLIYETIIELGIENHPHRVEFLLVIEFCSSNSFIYPIKFIHKG